MSGPLPTKVQQPSTPDVDFFFVAAFFVTAFFALDGGFV
jgi:hypothetical protein